MPVEPDRLRDSVFAGSIDVPAVGVSLAEALIVRVHLYEATEQEHLLLAISERLYREGGCFRSLVSGEMTDSLGLTE